VTPRILVQRILDALRPGGAKPYRGQRGAGQRWESLAAKHLRQAGYKVIERNFRGRASEIDLIAEEKGVLCFVEVKGRRGTGFGAPAEAVTLEKQRRIARAAEEYLAIKRLASPPCRFDVVAILESEGATEVTILRNAFEQPASPRPPR